jgi:hypothetical protein
LRQVTDAALHAAEDQHQPWVTQSSLLLQLLRPLKAL